MTDRTAEKAGGSPEEQPSGSGTPTAGRGAEESATKQKAATSTEPKDSGTTSTKQSAAAPSAATTEKRAPEGERSSLAGRTKSRIKAAADEHSANANAASRRGSAPSGVEGSVARHPAGKRAPRRARLRLTRIDPWSVMKTSFLLSIAFSIVLVVSVFMVWSVLSAAGVWESINSTVQSVLGGESASGFDVENYVGTSRVLGFTLLVAALDVVLLTAIATLGAFLYNMAAALLGGIEVTLAEDMH